MRRKLGIVCISIGAGLLLLALSLFAWNRVQADKAGESSQQLVQQLEQQLQMIEAGLTEENSPEQGEPVDTPVLPGLPEKIDPTMTETVIGGFYYIGVLEIPALDLKLPVMSDWSYDKLFISPCRYSGSTKTDDLVIMAHNFPMHFGRLTELSLGDSIVFTDMDGKRHHYEVVALETLEPAAVEDMIAGEYDLSLFTCTYGGRSRVTVRCDRIT